MKNQDYLKILLQGVDVWNEWRMQNPDEEIMLDRVELSGANLVNANLSRVHLAESNLNGVNLSGANLGGANCGGTKLINANLRKAHLINIYLGGADLSGADLSEADLNRSNLRGVNLSYARLILANLFETNLNLADFPGADLTWADLRNVNLNESNLKNANLQNVVIGGTILANTDLSNVIGLESVRHDSASTIGTNTLVRSKGKIPVKFLRGCGLGDWEIESAKLYNPELANEERSKILYKIYDLQASQAVQISPLFISYSHADGDFVDRLEKTLDKKGVRFWRDKHDMKAGRIEKQIDRAIRHNPTVLLILSKNSIESDWVQHEVRLARKLEKDTSRDVLCPVALDGSWKTSPWPERIMEQITEYNILDFSEWRDDEKFKKTFVKLIDGLNLYYEKEEDSS